MRISRSWRSVTARISSAMSPLSAVVLVHSGSFTVEEATYLGMLLILSAYSPPRDGHAAKKPSYVLRPSSTASASMSSWTLNLPPSSPELARPDQAPRPSVSIPTGSSITPSSDTNCDTTIRLIDPPRWCTWEGGRDTDTNRYRG